MKIQTPDLNKAAFYYAYKSKLLGIEGKYPRNIYILEVSKLVIWLEKFGWIPYIRYQNYRTLLKDKARQRQGMSVSFSHNPRGGFNFMDVAHVKGM